MYVLDHKYPEPLLNHSIKKLQQFGINKEDITITDSPDNPKVGNIVVEVFPYLSQRYKLELERRQNRQTFCVHRQ
mgnify:CR=1 FL=1